MSDNIPTLLTIKQFEAKHPNFTEGTLRWLIHLRKVNGIEAACIRRVGKRILIDEARFFAWLEAGGGARASRATPRVERKRAA